MREVLWEESTSTGQIIRVVQGDLTQETVDAIVNAANEGLAHGGGVAGAIVSRGGRKIQIESDAWIAKYGPVPTGSAAITGAGSLPSRYVIHAVGPVWGSGDEDAKLHRAVRSALELASSYALGSISLPGISSGIFGFPKARCARVMLDAVRQYLASHSQGTLREVNLCNIDAQSADIFRREAERWQGCEPEREDACTRMNKE